MKLCSHNKKYSVSCYEYFFNKDYFVIIMELCVKNLSQLLTEKIKKYKCGFKQKEIYSILIQLNKAFYIMNANKIIHRDIILENIFIKYNDKEHKDFAIKISDYGCSKKLNSLSKNFCNSFVGTII